MEGNSPSEHVRIVRISKGLLQFNKLRIGECCAISALLSARIMIQSGAHLGRSAAVVLRKVASMMRLRLLMVVVVIVVVAAMIKWRRDHY